MKPLPVKLIWPTKEPIQQILENRGFVNPFTGPSYIEEYRELSLYADLFNKFVQEASHHGRLGVCCDYDVDGLTSAAQIKLSLHLSKPILFFIPDRQKDGHGLNEGIVHNAVSLGITHLLCLDLGTSNTIALELAQTLGLRTMVIDHHKAESCRANFCLNFNLPNQTNRQELRDICTSHLVYRIFQNMGVRKAQFPELAYLGTICDMAPLTGLNKSLVYYATNYKGSELPFLKAYALKTGRDLSNPETIGFYLGPIINAVGRLGSPINMFNALTSNDQTFIDTELSAAFTLNETRKRLTQEGLEKIEEEVIKFSDKQKTIVAYNPSLHSGIVGIVAQRIAQKYHRPAFIFTSGPDNTLVGSGRSPTKDFSIISALKGISDGTLDKFGGHEGAGGCSLKKGKFVKFVSEFEGQASHLPSLKEVLVDVEITDKLPNLADYKELEPFGQGFHKPIFGVKNFWQYHPENVNVAGEINEYGFDIKYIETP